MQVKYRGVSLGLLTALLSISPASSDDLEITRGVTAGGGSISRGGSFEVRGTIGQPSTGYATGGAFELTGGFWFELTAGDCDEDGVTSLHDYTSLSECLAGPDVASPLECDCEDLNQDGFIDLTDFAALLGHFSAS